jgi:cation:H+ antiporter
MADLSFSLPVAVVVLSIAALVIGVGGTRLARLVDELADRTGLGEAIAGAVLMGAATSLAGLTVSIVGAAEGNASLAVGNSTGGIAAQTAYIVAADLAYRRGNLEHAAASLANVFNTMLLLILLAVVVLAANGPDVGVWGISPFTFLLLGLYAYGTYLAGNVSREPMWTPAKTPGTEVDEPDQDTSGRSMTRLWGEFAVLALLMLVAGFAVARSGISLVNETGLSGTVVGTFATSITTSLPELVTTLAAVRAGALTLAIGGIVGGNAFDLLFIAAADVAYRPGSIYAALQPVDVFVVGWAMLLVGILGAGLVRRQPSRTIGFEGVGVFAAYVGGLLVVTQLS